MTTKPNAVELTADQAWFIAETVGAGTFPWVLAITTPYTDAAERGAFLATQNAELTRMGMVSAAGVVNAAVADWVRVVCFPERWLDLRYVGSVAAGGGDDLLRGIIARRGGKTVVALRNAQLVTLTAMDIHDARALVPILSVGLAQRPPARFDEFSLPAQVGARADEGLAARYRFEGIITLRPMASGRVIAECALATASMRARISAGKGAVFRAAISI